MKIIFLVSLAIVACVALPTHTAQKPLIKTTTTTTSTTTTTTTEAPRIDAISTEDVKKEPVSKVTEPEAAHSRMARATRTVTGMGSAKDTDQSGPSAHTAPVGGMRSRRSMAVGTKGEGTTSIKHQTNTPVVHSVATKVTETGAISKAPEEHHKDCPDEMAPKETTGLKEDPKTATSSKAVRDTDHDKDHKKEHDKEDDKLHEKDHKKDEKKEHKSEHKHLNLDNGDSKIEEAVHLEEEQEHKQQQNKKKGTAAPHEAEKDKVEKPEEKKPEKPEDKKEKVDDKEKVAEKKTEKPDEKKEEKVDDKKKPDAEGGKVDGKHVVREERSGSHHQSHNMGHNGHHQSHNSGHGQGNSGRSGMHHQGGHQQSHAHMSNKGHNMHRRSAGGYGGGSTRTVVRSSGYSAESAPVVRAVKSSGYSAPAVRSSGYSSAVRVASAPVVKSSGYSAPAVRSSGYSSAVRVASAPVVRSSGYSSAVRSVPVVKSSSYAESDPVVKSSGYSAPTRTRSVTRQAVRSSYGRSLRLKSAPAIRTLDTGYAASEPAFDEVVETVPVRSVGYEQSAPVRTVVLEEPAPVRTVRLEEAPVRSSSYSRAVRLESPGYGASLFDEVDSGYEAPAIAIRSEDTGYASSEPAFDEVELVAPVRSAGYEESAPIRISSDRYRRETGAIAPAADLDPKKTHPLFMKPIGDVLKSTVPDTDPKSFTLDKVDMEEIKEKSKKPE